ncbi:MAG: sugar ABC transporter permease [Sphaerochaeta sp.]|nr:sugar ABC transporter permease [Sphaerochaeta sp.]PKL26262.1 MAG: sugar ABC transporter permease [Spirochaetae bacterium HGW-Spirochaetae-2]
MGQPPLRKKRDLLPYALVTPALAITIAIIFLPMFQTITYSFSQYILYKPQEKGFIGFENYKTAFSDPLFASSLIHTFVWIVSIIVFQFLLGFATALLLNRRFTGRGIARSLILVPWVTPSVITALMWRWMYDGNHGLINQLLAKFGLIKEFIPFLAQTSTAMGSIIVALIWQGFPFFAIMLLAGLQAIPDELYEAAEIDGATKTQRFFNVTIPMLKPVILTTILLRTIWVANSLDIILIMTGGGPGYSTYTLPVYSYIKAYKGMDFGYSSTIAVLLTILLMLIVTGYVRNILKSQED